MNDLTLLEIVAASIAVIGAGVAIWQAIVAKNAARSAKVDSSASRYERLTADYNKLATSGALKRLRQFKEKHDGKTFDERVSDWVADVESTRPSELARELDHDRRSAGELFHKAAVLVLKGALDAEWADEIKRWSGKDIVRDVVLPMNRAKRERLGTSAAGSMDFEEKILKVFFG